MADKDLVHHAARIYLWGNNSPFATDGEEGIICMHLNLLTCACCSSVPPVHLSGGPWHWPVDCPPSLVEMINPSDYATFADYANSLFHWDATGWEAIAFAVLSLLLPPYADAFMVLSLCV
jgi:hypothetical protein